MRKKSHISLAKYIVEDVRVPELEAHRKAFYLGSILPDCKFSFLTKRHEFGETFDLVTAQIRRLSEREGREHSNLRAYMRHLGEVIHYVADYFTFPHNNTYDGTLRDHSGGAGHLKSGRLPGADGAVCCLKLFDKCIKSTKKGCRFVKSAAFFSYFLCFPCSIVISTGRRAHSLPVSDRSG